MSQTAQNGKNSIDTAIKTNRLSHAILIITDNIVCEEIATYAASLLFNKSEASVYDVPDFIRIDAATLKVAHVDELLSELSVTPASGKRLIVFSNAGNMSVTVQNMLLKTIEEPPSGNHFIFYGNADGILPTIRSRCAILNPGQLSFEDTALYVQKQGASYEDALHYAYIAGGDVKRALLLHSDTEFYNYCTQCAEYICTVKQRTLICDKLRDFATTNALCAADIFDIALSDMRRYKLGLPIRAFTKEPLREKLVLCANRLSEKEISEITVLVRHAKYALNTNAPARQILDNFAAKTEQAVNYGR